MKKPRLLLFDLGNVLVKFEPVRFSEALGLDSGDAQKQYGSGLRELTNKYESGMWSTDDYFDSLGKFFQNRYDRRALERAFLSVLTDPVEGMENLVRAATAKMPSALVSNTNPIHFASVLHRLPALKYLPKRYLSYEVGAIKPSPEFYQHLLRHESVSPDEMLFIDDVEENIEAARKAGIEGYVFKNAEELNWELDRRSVFT